MAKLIKLFHTDNSNINKNGCTTEIKMSIFKNFLLTSHLLQSKNEQTLLYIGVKPCAKGSIYVALEWGYLYLTFFNISNNLFDFLTSNNLGVESEAGFGM